MLFVSVLTCSRVPQAVLAAATICITLQFVYFTHAPGFVGRRHRNLAEWHDRPQLGTHCATRIIVEPQFPLARQLHSW